MRIVRNKEYLMLIALIFMMINLIYLKKTSRGFNSKKGIMILPLFENKIPKPLLPHRIILYLN